MHRRGSVREGSKVAWLTLLVACVALGIGLGRADAGDGPHRDALEGPLGDARKAEAASCHRVRPSRARAS